MTDDKKTRVKLVRSDYQPKKSEVEETFEIRKPDGTTPTAEEIAQSLVRPVDVEFVDQPE